MLTQRTANIVFVSIVICTCAYFAWVAEGFVTSGLLASSGLPSKFFPQLMLGGTALCALITGYLYFAKGEAGGDAGEHVFETIAEGRRGLLMLVVCVVCYFVWREFGFIVMTIVLGPLSLLAMGIYRPLIYAIVWALSAIVFVTFRYGLNIQLV